MTDTSRFYLGASALALALAIGAGPPAVATELGGELRVAQAPGAPPLTEEEKAKQKKKREEGKPPADKAPPAGKPSGPPPGARPSGPPPQARPPGPPPQAKPSGPPPQVKPPEPPPQAKQPTAPPQARPQPGGPPPDRRGPIAAPDATPPQGAPKRFVPGRPPEVKQPAPDGRPPVGQPARPPGGLPQVKQPQPLPDGKQLPGQPARPPVAAPKGPEVPPKVDIVPPKAGAPSGQVLQEQPQIRPVSPQGEQKQSVPGAAAPGDQKPSAPAGDRSSPPGGAIGQPRLPVPGAGGQVSGRPGDRFSNPGPQRLEEVQKERRERTEAGGQRNVIEEPGGRFIVREKGRTFIRQDEGERFRRWGHARGRDVRTERRRDGVTVNILAGPGGTQIISEVSPDGHLLRRYRRGPDRREVILIDNRRHWRPGPRGGFVDIVVNLSPPVVRIPRDRYIVEYARASDEDIYEALSAPPIDRLDRVYSLEEVRQTVYLRDRMRRVDLDDVTFEFGAWEVTPDQFPKLERIASVIARVLDRNPNEVFMIEGHTDAVGSDVDNLSLSDRRAEAVAQVLVDVFQVPQENIVTQGYGEQFLKVNTQGPERLNRFVAVRRITPLISRGEP